VTLLLNIDVPDLNAAESFFSAAFGLRAGRRFGADVVELLGWPVPLYLLEKEPGTRGAGDDLRRYDRHWTPIHPDVVVTDLDAALDRAVAAGALVECAPCAAPYGRIAMLADPFGNGFCLIEFNEQGYDALSAAPAGLDHVTIHLREKMVLPVRIELTTSALPRMRSTTELRQHTSDRRPRRPQEERA
jgi:predicted enzyme related to lactoylglutathione lyase